VCQLQRMDLSIRLALGEQRLREFAEILQCQRWRRSDFMYPLS
jgi:hypothetical protein